LKQATSDNVELELFDATGKLISQVRWPSSPGQFFSQNILTQGLAEGVLFYRLKDGELVKEGKVIIIK